MTSTMQSYRWLRDLSILFVGFLLGLGLPREFGADPGQWFQHLKELGPVVNLALLLWLLYVLQDYLRFSHEQVSQRQQAADRRDRGVDRRDQGADRRDAALAEREHET